MKKSIRMLVVTLALLLVSMAFVACGNDTVAVTSISINGENTATVNVAEQYSVTITPTNATNKTVAWEVVSGTATINEDGLLTATATGTVTIKATADGKSDTKQITVKEAYIGTFEYSQEATEDDVVIGIMTNRLILNEDYTGRYFALLDGVELGGHFSFDITFSVNGNALSFVMGGETINGTFSDNFTKLTLNFDDEAVVDPVLIVLDKVL